MSRTDVIVPCYRYGHFLRECVTSVLRQSLADVRVLIIDDASPDETPQVAAALAAEDARVEVRRHAVNRGHIATYNEGIDWVTADYMLILSADDFLLPGALARAVAFLDAHPEVGFVYGRWIDYRTGEPLSIPPPRHQEPAWRIFEGGEFIRHLVPENHLATPTAVVRTRLQKELGGYRPNLPHAGDLEMWMRFAIHAPVGALAAYQAAYRRHDRNMSIDYYRSVLPDIEQRRLAIAEAFTGFGDRIPDRGDIEARAIHGLAEQAVRMAHAAFNRKDLPACVQCLEYARSICPDIRSSPVWARLLWKQRLGTTFCSFLYPIVQRLRHRTVAVAAVTDEVLTPRGMMICSTVDPPTSAASPRAPGLQGGARQSADLDVRP